MALIILCFILVFLLGFILGKRKGRILGYSEGKAEAPLEFREQSLLSGHCYLCQSLLSSLEKDRKPG